MTNVNSIDTDASGTLITTEFGGFFPSSFSSVPNFQAYNVKGVYAEMYGSTPPPFPYDVSPLVAQQDYWTAEIAYLTANDPDLVDVEPEGEGFQL